MKHASKKKLETPKFSPYAFTAGVELEKRRNVIDTVQTERSYVSQLSLEADGPVKKPAIDHSGSFAHSVESIRVSLHSSDEKEQIAKENFSSDSENFTPAYIDQNLNFTNSRVDDWKLNVMNVEDTSKSESRKNSAQS